MIGPRMKATVEIFVLIAGIFSLSYGEPFPCCNFIPQRLEGAETAAATTVDSGKGVFLRRLVGDVASLMRYEAGRETPPRELADRVDGVLVEAGSSLVPEVVGGGRRKAILIVGEIKEKERTFPAPKTDGGVVEQLHKEIEQEKEVERLRRQEWTAFFMRQRQEELKRRQEWAKQDSEIRNTEIELRRQWSNRLSEKVNRLSGIEPTGTPDSLAKSFLQALDATYGQTEKATPIYHDVWQNTPAPGQPPLPTA